MTMNNAKSEPMPLPVITAEIDGKGVVIRMDRVEANGLLQDCIDAAITGDFHSCREYLTAIRLALTDALLPLEED